MPDYGENDHHVVPREADTANGHKLSGWTNPLSWTDNGEGDEKVLHKKNRNIKSLLQTNARLGYDQSEGPTKVDMGELD